VVATEFGFSQKEPARRSRRQPFAITTENVVFVLFVGGLAWLPFWLGSNRSIAWGINAVVFPGLAALYELSLVLRGASHPVAIRRIGFSAVLFVLVIIWIVVQNATWMPTEWHHPIWRLAGDALGQQIAGSISVDRDLTALAFLRLMTAASTFWLALQLSADAARARLLIWCVVGIGAVYAAAGIFALTFMPNGRLFADLGPSRFVTSTFVNQNHYVTFAGIGLIACVGGILRIYRRELDRSGRHWQLKIATLINTTGSQAALPLAFAVVIMASVLLTGSRGGIIATALGLFTLFALSARKRGGSRWNEALLLGFAAILVATAFIAFSDVFVGRLLSRGLYDEGRRWAPLVILRSILSAPFLGYGYGTFEAVFPMFRDGSLSVLELWDKAHNTYLEILQGLGLVFGAMLIACVAVLVWDCVKGARTRRRNATIPAIAASVSFLVGAHALIDFSLQIQAVTLTYMAVLGAGVAQAREPLPVENVDVKLKDSSVDAGRWRVSSDERWL
jgi:O-antigen ligase